MNAEQTVTVAKWFREADRVLVATGAGMSIECGIDYSEERLFAQRHPGLPRLGVRNGWDGIGLMFSSGAPMELVWGYYADHALWMRWKTEPHRGYGQLAEIIRDHHKDTFAISSNADGMLERSGFQLDKLYLPQGGFHLLQCPVACTRETYEAKPFYERMMPKIDRATSMLTDSSLLPRCPNCGRVLVLNARGDEYFIHDPYLPQQLALIKWVEDCKAKGERLLVLEIGIGGSTPTVVRFPDEGIVREIGTDKATLVRVNLQYPEIPDDVVGLSVRCGAVEFMEKLYTRLQSTAAGGEADDGADAVAVALKAQRESGDTYEASKVNWRKLFQNLR